MFTGLVEALGKIKAIDIKNRAYSIMIDLSALTADISVGDSIAIDGLCLTVEEINKDNGVFTAIESTVKKSIIGMYKREQIVNLETSLTLNKYIGGHIVNGHIDDKGLIRKMQFTGKTLSIEILISSGIGKYLIENDSIAVNGVSLTVKKVYGNAFVVEIIPETKDRTNLNLLKIGDRVNVEINHFTKSIYEFTKRGR